MGAFSGDNDRILKAIESKFSKTDSKDMVYKKGRKYECASTGSSNLDLAISSNNQDMGLLIKGRLTEASGLESSGKSTLLYSNASRAIKDKNWSGILIDSEGAWDAQYGKALGLVEGANFKVFQPVTSEDTEILLNMLFGLGKGNSKTKVNLDFVLWDSITASAPAEMLDSEDSTGTGAAKGVHARLWSNLIRKLNKIAISQRVAFCFVNQLRNKMDLSSMYQEKVIKTENALAAGFSSDNGKTTTGGVAIRYFMSVRVLLQQTKRLKEEVTIRGTKIVTKGRLNYIRMDVIKNKVDIPFRSAMTAIQFGKGYRDEVPQFDYLVALKNGTVTSSTTGVYGFDFGDVSLSIKGLPNLQKELFGRHRETLKEAYLYYMNKEYDELYELNANSDDILYDEDIDLEDIDLYEETKPKVRKRTKPARRATKPKKPRRR